MHRVTVHQTDGTVKRFSCGDFAAAVATYNRTFAWLPAARSSIEVKDSTTGRYRVLLTGSSPVDPASVSGDRSPGGRATRQGVLDV